MSNDKKVVKPEVKKEEVLNLDSFKSELEALREELKKLQEEKNRLSQKELKAIEEAREEMITDDELGSLYIDEKYKEDGYFYRIVDSSRHGRVAQHIKRGYEVVQDPNLVVGDNTVNKSNHLGSAVTVELGRDRGSCTGILMRIPLEQYNKRQAAKVRRNRELDAATMQQMVDKSEFGEITIGNDIYKK